MRVYITSYDRPDMLKKVASQFENPVIFEDGVTHPFRGKQEYWRTWDEILKDCEKNPSELYLFTPDDFLDLDIGRVLEIHERLSNRPYVCNIINDGRHQCWGGFKKQEPVNGLEQVGFCDCGFFCNREALEATKWRIKPVPPERWERDPNMSSGVGQQLTYCFMNRKIKMYKPVKSLAFHGDHESKMNPSERLKNPLISK